MGAAGGAGAGADALYDSSAVPHASRWSLPLPDAEATLADLAGRRVRASGHLLKVSPKLSLVFQASIASEKSNRGSGKYSQQIGKWLGCGRSGLNGE